MNLENVAQKFKLVYQILTKLMAKINRKLFIGITGTVQNSIYHIALSYFLKCSANTSNNFSCNVSVVNS